MTACNSGEGSNSVKDSDHINCGHHSNGSSGRDSGGSGSNGDGKNSDGSKGNSEMTGNGDVQQSNRRATEQQTGNING